MLLFAFRKLYPEYASKNIMFKAFLEGLEKSYLKPDFGMYKGVNEPPFNQMKDDYAVRANYAPEFRKAFMDAGVIAKPATPPAPPTSKVDFSELTEMEREIEESYADDLEVEKIKAQELKKK